MFKVNSVKKVLSVFLMLVLIWEVFPIRAEAVEEEKTNLTLYARSAVLMDADSGRILYGKNETEILPNASTTKILTCIITLEREKDLESQVTVSGYAASMPRVHLGMQKGEHYRLEDLLYSMMLESHNDSAVAIAEYVAGTTEHFAILMNRKAQEIGCQDSFFITPNGLDAEVPATGRAGAAETKAHGTTATDLAKIMSYCISQSPQKEKFLEITRTANYSFSNRENRSFSCSNHNAFLQMMEGALSGKTGYTGKASYCYVGALQRDNRTFVVALLSCGWPGHKTYKWVDTRKLMEYGLENYHYKEVFQKLQFPDVLVENGMPDREKGPFAECHVPVQVETEGIASMPVLMTDTDQVEVKSRCSEKVTAPITSGQKVGEVDYYVNGEPLKCFPIVLTRAVEARDFGYWMKVVWKGYFFCS